MLCEFGVRPAVQHLPECEERQRREQGDETAAQHEQRSGRKSAGNRTRARGDGKEREDERGKNLIARREVDDDSDDCDCNVDQRHLAHGAHHSVPKRTEESFLPYGEVNAETAAHDGQHRYEDYDEEQTTEPAHQCTPKDE